MSNNSVTIVPHGSGDSGEITNRILNGNPGKSMLHKVGSAKQYATKSVVGRVANQAKFPMSEKSSPRKRG